MSYTNNMSEKKRNKFKGEKIDYVKKIMKKDKTLTITSASKKMCKKFDIEYTESVRKAVSASLNSSIKKEKTRREIEKIENSEEFLMAKCKKHDKSKNVFLITWAQNATPVHSRLLRNMEAYAEFLNAGIHVIAGRYRNPTSQWTQTNQEFEYWEPEIKKYLDANRHKLHKYLHVLSDVKVQPTASNPLSGMNGLTGLESCIIGHPRQHLKSLPVLDGYPNKLLVSTGSITVENYTDSKSGKKGEFHHSLGFVVVELDGDHFHVRQVSADRNGNFYDIFHRVKNGKVNKNNEGCEAAILGDIHLGYNHKEATAKAFELLDYMKPNHTMIHDIFDGDSISHHHLHDPFELMEKEEGNRDDLEQEINKMVDWVRDRLKYNLVIVKSNHDDFLDRWLRSNDWRKNINRKAYLKYAYILSNNPVRKGMIAHVLDTEFGEDITTLGLDDSYRVKEWELGMHGHIGASGSRGGINQFKNLNTKVVTGHTHTPQRIDGAAIVGCLTKLRMGYNKGASSWMHSIALIYPDGKLQQLHLINGRFTRLF